MGTCKHCTGEFCWDCFGDWKLHQGKTCEQTPKVTRRKFGEIVPYKRWPKDKKTVSESEKHDLEFHANLAYQNFISGFGEDDAEFDEQLVYELNEDYVAPVKAEVVKRVRFADEEEEEVEGKQDESNDDLIDKVVSPIQFETPFQIEAQQNIAVTPTLPVSFTDENEESDPPSTPPLVGEVGEKKDDEEVKSESELLLNIFAQAASVVMVDKRDPSMQSDEKASSPVLDDKRSAELSLKCEESDSGEDQKMDEKESTEEKEPTPKYNIRWEQLPKECPRTQINYFRFIQGFTVPDEPEDLETVQTEACTDVKGQ